MENDQILDLREQYFKVSNHIYEMDLDFYEIGVYQFICRCVNNKTKAAFPSIRYTQSKIKLSRPKIISTIKSLIEKELIHKIQGYQGKNNNYYLLPFNMDKSKIIAQIAKDGNPHLPSGKPELPDGKSHLPGVVNDVNSIKTNKKRLIKNTKEEGPAKAERSPKGGLKKYSDEEIALAKRAWEYFKDNDRLPETESRRKSFYWKQVEMARQILANNTPEDVTEILKWATSQEFWMDNFSNLSQWDSIKIQFKGRKEDER